MTKIKIMPLDHISGKKIFLAVGFFAFILLPAVAGAADGSQLMSAMKSNGCVWDGLFSNYVGSGTDDAVALLNRSGCQYLHRSQETWAWPPDFSLTQSIMAKITKPNLIYGMNIAEAISTTATYYYPDESRNFNFASMCMPGTTGRWGTNTCIPSYASAEYQKYLMYITKKAIDMGFQDFAFGQTYLCDNMSNPVLPSLISQIRQYAASKGKSIVIGGQTNDIKNESYLRSFDYIFGGIGIKADGVLETGSCASKYPSMCWALLWDPTFASKANNILVNLDWDNSNIDDQSQFVKMNQSQRAASLSNYYNFFKNKGMGFLMPYQAPLTGNENGCYGPNKNFYSPDNKYYCKDEDTMNQILGVNVVKKSDLSTCATAAECLSNICLDGYCGLKPDGWGCLGNSVCSSGLCQNGTCVAKCVPKTCSQLGYVCGSQSDGCGGSISCSACASGMVCSSGQCVSNCTSHASEKCDGSQLFWYNSCNAKEELAQDCGTDTVTSIYQCNGNWLQRDTVKKGCTNGACYSSDSWTNDTDCSISNKTCQVNACLAANTNPPAVNAVAPAVNITANGSQGSATVGAGDPVTLSWNSTSADTCRASGDWSGNLTTSGTQTMAASQSKTYTITCTNSSGPSSASITVNVQANTNTNTNTDTVTQKPATQMTRAELLAAIARIQALIADLQKQLAALTGSPTQNASANQSTTFSCTSITQNLFYGMKNDPQVKCLQEILKAQGLFDGTVTGNFGAVTKAAVIQFQQKYAGEILTPYGLKYGSGYVGTATRVIINNSFAEK